MKYRTPPFDLDIGEYDLAVVSEPDGLQVTVSVFSASQTTDLGDAVTMPLGYREGGHWPGFWYYRRLSLRERSERISIGVTVELDDSVTPIDHLRVLLVPRLGQIWRGEDLAHPRIAVADREVLCGHPDGKGGWTVLEEEWFDSHLIYGPYIPLHSGDYVAFFRINCHGRAGDHLELRFDVVSPRCESANASFHPFDRNVWEEYPVPFQLDQPTEKVEFRVRTSEPCALTIAHVRIATSGDLIWERYFELGGIDSPLGHPLSAVFSAAPSKYGTRGMLRRFSAGTIYWASRFGACETFGSIGFKYEQMGGTYAEASPRFGFPRDVPQRALSSFGTSASVQRFEGYDDKAAIYSGQFPWGTAVYEVHGGIAYEYFRNLGGHSGKLGLPMSDEYWDTEAEGIRRSDFEGGHIRWQRDAKGEWHKLATLFYPRPKLTVSFQPSEILVAEPVTICLEAENLGGEADEGYITISFPDSITNEPEVNTDGQLRVSHAGADSFGNYGHPGYELRYLRVEAVYSPWKEGSQNWLRVTVKPKEPGPFRFLARSTAGPIPKYKHVDPPVRFEADPSPFGSEPIDQQDEHVYENIVSVREKLLPKLELVPESVPSLVIRHEDTITLKLTNSGPGAAKRIVVVASEKMDGTTSDAIPLLPAGASQNIEMDVRPGVPGNVRSEFTINYEDEYGGEHTIVVKSIRLQVKDAEQRQTSSIENLIIGRLEQHHTSVGSVATGDASPVRIVGDDSVRS